jgi:hypothetical protein
LTGEIEQVAFARYAFAVHDVELRFAKRRCAFILHDLYTCAIADRLIAFLDRSDAANVEPQAGVEFQRLAARRSFQASRKRRLSSREAG